MAENQFPEYDNVGVVGGSKMLADLQKEFAQIETDLRKGYSPQRGKVLRADLPQFSDARNALLDRQAEIDSRIAVLRSKLVVAAKAYVPLSGPESKSGKQEKELVARILAAPISPASADIAVGAGIATPATTTGTQPPVAGETEAQALARVGATVQPAVANSAGSVGGTGGGTGNPNRVLRSAVDKALKDQGLKDTPANRRKVRSEIAAKGAVADTSWEPQFKSQYPQYAWMFTDEMKTKYPDMFQLFKDASADPDFDPNLFARRFDGSSFYTELKASSKTRELISSIGSFTWGSGNLAKFLTTAEQMTWTGENLKQEAYKELFRKGADGKYANDLAVKEVQASTPYQQLKRIGTRFLAPMDDARVIESLTGGISSDDVLRLARERAKAMYPHLAASIDAGLTLEDLAYDYKAMAAQTLELTPDQINMGDAKFNVALKSGEGGKERMMSTGEWEQKLRTDPNYGYQFTKKANKDATNIALSLARAFGKVD